MKNMNKREFLRMLGLGGMAVLAAPVLAKVPLARDTTGEARLIHKRGHLFESDSFFAHPVPLRGAIEARFSNGANMRMTLPAGLRDGDEIVLGVIPAGVSLKSVVIDSFTDAGTTVSFGKRA